jgi:nucleotide-binding universal stress UspA family protein
MNVIDTDVIPPSTLLAFIRHDKPLDQAKEDLKNILEGGVKQMLEERVRVSKELGAERVSHMVGAGKPAEEIIAVAEEENCDVVVMASGKIMSPVRSLGSVARRVLDSTRKPILIIHE